MTNAAHDQVVYSPALPGTLAWAYPERVRHAEVVGDAREATVRVELVEGTTGEFEFPHYAQSGHAVSWSQPEVFKADVEDFLTR